MDQQICVASAAAYYFMLAVYKIKKEEQRKKKKKRWWRVSLYKNRERYNATNLLEDLRKEPSVYFENFCRMSASDFEYLLGKIGPLITKTDTNMRKSIPVQERLAVTLRFFATGDSFKSLSYLFKFSPQTVSRCVTDVCRALINELKDKIKLPKSSDEWRKISEEFKNKWNFPKCLGALDGKHIIIQAPLQSGTEFYNYKGTFSIVLMAVVNANYEFIYVDIGCQGRISDGGVFRNTSFYKKLSKDQLMLPESESSANEEVPLPYVFVADEAFALTTRMLKPYPGIYNKGTQERIFNYRLSRARRVVENVFGILSSVFRIFRKPILLEPSRVTEITMTCVLLHNFLRESRTSKSRYMPPECIDSEVEGFLTPGTWRNDPNMTSFLPLKKVARKPMEDAKIIRNSYAKYFATRGAVPWQNNVLEV